ncbi:MAG: HTTM domain-containing protein [Chloroflexi bacterium]|nr:HTTM domain-containing protein [Chloroflexota bacterium]
MNWTERRASVSWHMKLRDKQELCAVLRDQSAERCHLEIQPLDYLTERQVDQMVTQPDMIL